jgi:hypothetical protein
LWYGTDGQPEFLIDCSGKPLARCHDKALDICPQGYFLVRESQTPGGTKSGSIFGHLPYVGASGNDTDVKFQNHVVVRCRAASAAVPR